MISSLIKKISLFGCRLYWRLSHNYKGINKRISHNDWMYKHAPHHYFRWGQKALERIELTLEKFGKPKIESILDLPCGHGRELRFFKVAFPETNITACDIDKDAVDFCVKTFNVQGVYSHTDPLQIPITEKFDLIWCGSLLTHLDEESWKGFLKFFNDRLNQSGILIFTTHGQHIIELFRAGKLNLSVSPEAKELLLRNYDLNSFSYCPYSENSDAGVSLSSPDWVRDRLSEIPDLRLLEYVERGWWNFQDSVACIREG